MVRATTIDAIRANDAADAYAVGAPAHDAAGLAIGILLGRLAALEPIVDAAIKLTARTLVVGDEDAHGPEYAALVRAIRALARG